MTSKALSLELRHRCNRPLSDILAAVLHPAQPQHPPTLPESSSGTATVPPTPPPPHGGQVWCFFFFLFCFICARRLLPFPETKDRGRCQPRPRALRAAPGQRHLRPGEDRGDPGVPPLPSFPHTGGVPTSPHAPLSRHLTAPTAVRRPLGGGAG